MIMPAPHFERDQHNTLVYWCRIRLGTILQSIAKIHDQMIGLPLAMSRLSTERLLQQ